MSNLSKQDKMLLAILLTLITLFLYYTFLMAPSFHAIANAKAEIEVNNGKLTVLENKKLENEKIKNQLKNLTTKYEDAKQAITIGIKDDEIVSNLSKICIKDNMKLSSVTFSQGTAYSYFNKSTGTNSSKQTTINGQLMTTETSISVTGNVADIIKFIDDFEHTDRIGIISTVSLSQSDNTNKATITANYFYFQGGDINTTSNSNKSSK